MPSPWLAEVGADVSNLEAGRVHGRHRQHEGLRLGAVLMRVPAAIPRQRSLACCQSHAGFPQIGARPPTGLDSNESAH